MRTAKTNQNGFTLVELLVVIAIIALLISLLIPAVQAAREMARRSQCSNNMRQMALAMNVYHESMKSLPPGNIAFENLREQACHTAGDVYCGSIGWPAFILPYLEQMPLYDRIDFEAFAYCPDPGEESLHESSAHGDEKNKEAALQMPSVFSCPSAERRSPYHKDYGVNGDNGFPQSVPTGNELFACNSSTRFSDVKDGLSNTFLMLEACHSRAWRYQGTENIVKTDTGLNPFFWVGQVGQGYVVSGYIPVPEIYHLPINTKNPYYGAYGARSGHAGRGSVVSMCDGSVHFVSEKIDFSIYEGLFTKSGGEDVRLP